MNLNQTIFLQFVGADPISSFLVFSPPLVLIRHLFDFLEEGTPLLELSMTIAEKEVRHAGGEWILFRRRGRKGNYQQKILVLPYQPRVHYTVHCVSSCDFLKLSF
jgi:hypothetical protein